MKQLYFFLMMIVALGFSACSKAELPEMIGEDIITICEYDEAKQQYHFTARLSNSGSAEITERGFTVGLGKTTIITDADGSKKEECSDLTSIKDFKDVKVTSEGFEFYVSGEADWQLKQYYVSAYVRTGHGRFQGTDFKQIPHIQ